MSDKKIPTRMVRKDDFRGSWQKALELHGMMEEALLGERWDAAALNGIHAAILANDAVLTCFHGVRSSSRKHDDAARLLLTLMKTAESKNAAKHLSRLVQRKSLIEYTGECLTPGESVELCKHAQLFLDWAKSILPAAESSGI
jgi:hypothetical protein